MKNMKKMYTLFKSLITVVILSVGSLAVNAQTTISTITGSNYTGANGWTGASSVTFVVENTNASPMLLTNVEVFWKTANSGAIPSLWYSTASVSGAPTITSPNWTLITTAPAVTVPANGYYNTFTNLSFIIPGNTTYRFAVQSTNGISYSGANPSPSPSSFSGAGVNLHVFNYQIGGLNVGYAGAFPSPTFNPRAFTGSITVMPAVPCIAPPTAGIAVAQVNPVCPTQTANINLTGNTSGLGQTYQWQSSPDSITWTDIPGETNQGFSAVLPGSGYYRAIVTCSAQSDTSSAVFMQINPFYNCYCASNATSTLDEYIDTVRIGSFANQSFGQCATYTNFYNTVSAPILFMGDTIPASVSTRDCENTGFYSRYVEMYIDYNQDGVFSDPTERVLFGSAANLAQSSVNMNIIIPNTALSGPTGMRVVCREFGDATSVTPCGTYSYGETEDYLVDIRPYPTNDAGISSIISPTVAPELSCSVNDTATVILSSYGLDTLVSADIIIAINNTIVDTVNWTGSIAFGQTEVVNMGYYNFNDGDFVKIWVSNPNGNTDELETNDTLSLNVYDALNGVYTVYGTTPDFNTLADAVDALMTRGICDDVTFDLRSGAYTDQASIGQFPIVGNGNFDVTIKSESNNAADVVVTSPIPTTNTNYVIELNGADHVNIQDLTLQNALSLSTVINIINNSENNKIEDCIIIGDTMAAALSNNYVIKSLNGNDKNLTIKGNHIRGGGAALWLFGADANTYEEGLVIEDNLIEDYYGAGFVGVYLFRPQIHHNILATDTMNFNGNVFHLDVEESLGGIELVNNSIKGVQGGFGINLSNVDASPSNPSLVANNMVYLGSTVNPTYSEAIALQNVTNADVMFNSLHVRSMEPSTGAVRVFNGATNGVRLMNNNIVNSGDGFAINSESANYIAASDYNNLYVAGNNLVNIGGTNYADLAAYQSATGMESNSISVDPLFVNDDLHTCVADLDGAGLTIAGITEDFDGDVRNANTPDIGADEFISTSVFTLGNDIIKCANDTVTLAVDDIQDATYNWSPFFQTTSSIEVDLPGLYFVQVVTSCGLAVDSINISNIPSATASFTSNVSYFSVGFTNTSTNALTYAWDFGDGNTSTDENPTHVYDDEGSYTVTLTVTDECGNSITSTQTVVIDVQFNGISSEVFTDLIMYPNPTSDIVNIQFALATSEVITIDLMDLSGRIISSKNLGVQQGFMNTQLNLDRNASGTYIVRINAGSNFSNHRVVLR
jgi:PKD repeat protein